METNGKRQRSTWVLLVLVLCMKMRSGKEKKGKKFAINEKKSKKSCLYYYNLKRLLGERLIATDYVMGNSTNLVDISEVLQKKHLQGPINNVISNGEEKNMGHENSEPEKLEENKGDDREEESSLMDL